MAEQHYLCPIRKPSESSRSGFRTIRGKLAWKILHDGVRYIEQGNETTPKARKRRAQRPTQALRKLGYAVTLSPIIPTTLADGQG